MNDVPEKLHMPTKDKCENGHVLLKNGKPTPNLVWDHEGKPDCLNCFVNKRGHHNMIKGKCSQGHATEPGKISFVWKDGKAEAKCPKCS